VDILEDNVTRLELSLPPLAEEVDQIEVLDRDGDPVKQVRRARIESDHENNRVGIVLYLKRAPKTEFRLRLYDDKDEHDGKRK